MKLDHRTKNISGQRFGRLTAVEPVRIQTAAVHRKSEIAWRCVCECGGEKIVLGRSLRFGSTVSCGCLSRERWSKMGRARATHGRSRTPEHITWLAMRTRCERQDRKDFVNYGGRGIKVCERWQKFEHFFADMGPRPTPSHSLDRINNDGNYEPGNCRWATRTEQVRNSRHTILTPESALKVCALRADGLTQREIAARLGVTRAVVCGVLCGVTWSDVTGIRRDETNRRAPRGKRAGAN